MAEIIMLQNKTISKNSNITSSSINNNNSSPIGIPSPSSQK